MHKTILCSLIFFLSLLAQADPETDKAIQEVQKMMESSDFQKNAAKNSKEAAEVDKYVKDISGSPEVEQDIYKLAAEVLGNMKGKSVDEMRAALEKAKSNPEEFYKNWTPEQKARLKVLSERLPAAQTKKP